MTEQYTNIAHRGAQGARQGRSVPDPPGGMVHDYVPFYYAPRSPMLYAINGGRVEGCTLTQQDVIHLETTVERVLLGDRPFVIYDRNATLSYAMSYTTLADLDKVAWDVILQSPTLDGFCKYFNNRPSNPDRLERRMAEFMVRGDVPLERLTRIGVIDQLRQQQVVAALRKADVSLPVEIKPEWYFLGQ